MGAKARLMTGTGARSSRSRGEDTAPVNSASVRGVRPMAAERTTGAGSATGGVLVAQPLLGQRLAHAVDVEAQLARLQPRAGRRLLARGGGAQHGFRLGAAHHDHA